MDFIEILSLTSYLATMIFYVVSTLLASRYMVKAQRDWGTAKDWRKFQVWAFCSLVASGILTRTEPAELKEPIAIDIIIHSNGDLEVVSEPIEADVKASLGEFTVTGYCSCEKCCGEYANGITATGTVATEGRTVAADPKVLPYGTEIEIDGQRYVVEDCGGAIKGNRLDLYFDSHEEALQHGVQVKEVFVSEEY